MAHIRRPHRKTAIVSSNNIRFSQMKVSRTFLMYCTAFLQVPFFLSFFLFFFSLRSLTYVNFINYGNSQSLFFYFLYFVLHLVFCSKITEIQCCKFSVKIYSDDNSTENVEIIYWFVHYLISDLVNFDLFEGRSG